MDARGHINPAVTFGLFLARSSAPSSSSTPSSPPPTSRGTPGTPTFPSLPRCQSGSPCSWSTWPPSPSPAPASTWRGASARPSCSKRNMQMPHWHQLANELKELKEIHMEDTEEEEMHDIDNCDVGNSLAVVEYVDEIYSFYRRTEVHYKLELLW
ncbi:hypothetical protein ACQJBY_001221 [Aegilops geniculata]